MIVVQASIGHENLWPREPIKAEVYENLNIVFGREAITSSLSIELSHCDNVLIQVDEESGGLIIEFVDVDGNEHKHLLAELAFNAAHSR